MSQKEIQKSATTPTTQGTGAFAQTSFSRGPMVLPGRQSPGSAPQDNHITQTPSGESGSPTNQLRPPTRHHITQSVEVAQDAEREKSTRPIISESQSPQVTNSSPEPRPTTLDRPSIAHEQLQEQQRQQVIQQRQKAEIEQNAVVAAASASNAGPFNHRAQWNRTTPAATDDNSSTAHHLSLVALLLSIMLSLM